MRVWLAVVIVVSACDSGKQATPAPEPKPPARDAAIVMMDGPAPPSTLQVFGVGQSPMSMAVVGDTLFWTDSAGAVWSMPKRGGRILQLSEQHDVGEPFFQNVVAHGGDLVAAKKGDLARFGPQGPQRPLDLGLGTDQLLELVSDGTAVYATSYETNKIYKVVDNKATKLLDHRRAAIDVEGDTLYALSYATGVLVAVKTSGGTPRTIVTAGLPKPTGFATDATSAYAWCEKDGVLRKVDLKTGKITDLAKDGLDNSDTLVEDGDWIYLYTWHGPHAGKVLRVAKDGSKTEVIADQLSAPYDIAIDDEAVFVTVRDDNKILRLEKSAIRAL